MNPDAAPTHLPNVPGYEILRQIGEGGMGAVYKARHVHMDRVVALKVILKERLSDPETLARFKREARAAAKLMHPNIVAVYDSGQTGDTHFIVMEYVDGIDLSDLVRESGKLPIDDACACIRQAALGLQHAHEKGLVHRDIKPSNLLRTVDGVVKILDMGLARLENGGGPQHLSLTQKGTMMGTPAYIAPEQALDSKTADVRADVYSLGCTLYHLLTGRPPFPDGSLAEILLKHQLAEPEPIEQLRPDAPRELGDIVRKMMAKRPADRYQTPGEVAQALKEFSASEPSALAQSYRRLPALPSRDSLTTPPAQPAITATFTTDQQPSAHWNKEATPAARRGGRALVFWGVVAVAVGALAGLGYWASEARQGEVRAHIAAGQFAEAAALIDSSGLRLTLQRDKLRDEVQAAWLEKAKGELQKQNFGAAIKTAQEMLEPGRFPDNAEARELIAQTGARAVANLKAAGRFSDALEMTTTLGADDKAKLQEEIISAALTAVARDLDAKNWDRAEKTTADVLRFAPKHARAREFRVNALLAAGKLAAAGREIADNKDALGAQAGALQTQLHEAQTRKLAQAEAEIKKLAADHKYLDAFARLDADAAELGEGGEQRRTALRAELLAHARAELKADRRDEAERLLRGYLAYKPDDSDAKNLLEQAAPADRPAWERHLADAAALLDAGDFDKAKELLDKAAPLADAPAAKARIAALQGYLRAARLQAQNKPAEAADALLAETLKGDSLPPDLASGSRKARILDLLQAAAEAKRNHGADAHAKPFATPADADAAFRYLAKAEAVAGADLSPAARATHALAAWSKPEHDPAAVAALITSLTKADTKLPFEETMTLFLTLAQAQQAVPAQRADALTTYARLLDLAQQQIDQPVAPTELAAEVLQPALKLGDELTRGNPDAVLAAKVAKVYAAQGHLLRKSPSAFKDAAKRALDSYTRAAQLDPSEPTYAADRVAARVDLGGEPAALLAEAEQAAVKAPNYPPAQRLLGLLRFHVARRAGDAATRRQKLREAAAAYDAGIRLYDDKKRPSDEVLPDLLTSGSAVYLNLSAAGLPRDEQIKVLHKSRDYAERATKLDRRFGEYAFTALGNALEELAYYLQEAPAANFAEAIKAFGEAKKLRNDLAKSWLDLGRCQFRAVAGEHADKKLLEDAAYNLEQAVERGGKPDEATDAARAAYWLGEVHKARKQPAEADKAYAKAAELAAKYDSASWSLYALAPAYRELEVLRRSPTDAAAAKHLRQVAETVLVKNKDVEAAKLLGDSYLVQDDPAAAYQAYGRGLPDKLGEATPAHVALLMARTDTLMTEKGQRDIQATPETMIAEADRAAELTKSGPALGNAGRARVLALATAKLNAETRTKYRQEAVDRLRQAIALAPDHPNSWLWRFEFARELRTARTTADDGAKLKAEALARLKEARAKAPATFRNLIDDMIRTWEAE